MNKLFGIIFFIIFSFSTIAQEVVLKNETDSFSYAFGILIGNNLKTAGFSEINDTLLALGAQQTFEEKATLTIEEAVTIMKNMEQKIKEKQHEATIKKGKEFMKKNKQRKEVTELPSGLQYEVIVEAEGPKPEATDLVTTHYHGTLIDGTVFDSSVDRGEPIQFPLNRVIAGWTEGLQLMSVGAKYKFYIPPELAYGAQGAGSIGPYETLIFEVELISIDENNN